MNNNGYYKAGNKLKPVSTDNKVLFYLLYYVHDWVNIFNFNNMSDWVCARYFNVTAAITTK